MTTTQRTIIPRPLNPRDTNALTHQLSAGDRVRITTTERPRTILTVSETRSSTTHAPQLVLIAPTTTPQHATYHCTALWSNLPMTVIEYTHTASDTSARCLGSLTIIAHLPRLSTPADDTAPRTKGCGNE
ncbi:hypothetical protein [Haladaptatus sp. DFWS20]|uniref:hypothetical protein n=1 Tax=Haladaptatus sp. DFWS20 TaxID=3403467 RepID=UPI003EC1466D